MQLAELSWPTVQAQSRDIPIVLPVAALEQHGHHLPVFTDSFLLGEVIRRASQRLHDRVVFAPLLWLGNSHHHLDFPGTMSAGPRTYLDLLSDLMENFLVHGFRRLVFVNGHGGNIVPGQQAVFEVRQRHRERRDLLLAFVTYWELGRSPVELGVGIEQPTMGHACEWETSMILRLRPELVRGHETLAATAMEPPLRPASLGWTTKDRTEAGHIGYPAKASAEKGEALFANFADGLVAFLEQVLAWKGPA